MPQDNANRASVSSYLLDTALVGFFKALKEVGYEDGVSPEPLGRIPKEMPAEEGAKLACDTARAVMRKAGIDV